MAAHCHTGPLTGCVTKQMISQVEGSLQLQGTQLYVATWALCQMYLQTVHHFMSKTLQRRWLQVTALKVQVLQTLGSLCCNWALVARCSKILVRALQSWLQQGLRNEPLLPMCTPLSQRMLLQHLSFRSTCRCFSRATCRSISSCHAFDNRRSSRSLGSATYHATAS